jgi:hypothetical protein
MAAGCTTRQTVARLHSELERGRTLALRAEAAETASESQALRAQSAVQLRRSGALLRPRRGRPAGAPSAASR